MVKRVISRISLSTIVLAAGLFLWSNVEQANAQVQLTESIEAEYPCMPGFPTYPSCVFKKKEDKKTE